MSTERVEKAHCVAVLDTGTTFGIGSFRFSDRTELREGTVTDPIGDPVSTREILNHIVENIRDYAIFAQDANGQILSWNQGVTAIFGYNEEEFVGTHVSVIFTPEDIENGEVEEQMRESEAKGRAIDRKWHVRRDGSRFWANGLLMPMWDGERKLRGYARVIRDDTQQKAFEDERDMILRLETDARRQAERLRESLERAERDKDKFLALLAHELRNPLNAILGWLVILRKSREDERLLAKGLDAIEASARSQHRMIEDVFDLSRISSGNLRLNTQPMLLNEAVARAVESTRPAAQAKSISLESAIWPEKLFIAGDSDRIQQAIVNVLSNAVKFTQKDGRVLVRLTCANSMAHVTIEDNGPGLNAEFLPRIFDRYAQADKSSTRGQSGLGLGLPLVREIVERHGGKVTAKSAGENLGATFAIELPTIELTPFAC